MCSEKEVSCFTFFCLSVHPALDSFPVSLFFLPSRDPQWISPVLWRLDFTLGDSASLHGCDSLFSDFSAPRLDCCVLPQGIRNLCLPPPTQWCALVVWWIFFPPVVSIVSQWSQFIFPNASQCKLISIKMNSYSTPSEMSLMTTKSLGLWGAYCLLLSPQTYNLFRYTLVPTTSTTALFILLWLVFCSVLCFWDRASLDNHASLQLRICPSQSPESWNNRRTLSREIGCSLSQREREDFSSPDQC